MERNAVILPVLLENPPRGGIRPFTRLHDYYSMLNGGVTGASVARHYNTIVPVVYRKYPVEDYLPTLTRREITPKAIRDVSPVYDYILVFGYDRTAIDALNNSGLRLKYEKGEVRVFEVPDER